MNDQANKQQSGAGAQTQTAPQRGPAREDPRFTRQAQTQAGFETRQVCGYNASGEARTFNLLAKEELPQGWSDAPPKGTHPNDPNRGSGQAGGEPAAS